MNLGVRSSRPNTNGERDLREIGSHRIASGQRRAQAQGFGLGRFWLPNVQIDRLVFEDSTDLELASERFDVAPERGEVQVVLVLDAGGSPALRAYLRGSGTSARESLRGHTVLAATTPDSPPASRDVNEEAKPYQIRQFLRIVERYALTLEEET